MTNPIDEHLPRQLGFWGIWLLAFNGMLGAGIYGVPARAAQLAGPWAPWMYLGCACLVLPILLSFGELASRFRRTGGQGVPAVLVLAGLPSAFGGLPVLAATAAPALDIGAATLLLIFAFVGFESAVVPAGEASRPERDMPRALLLGLLVVGVLYFAIQWIGQAALPTLAESSTPLLDVAAALLGRPGSILLMFGVLCSVLAAAPLAITMSIM